MTTLGHDSEPALCLVRPFRTPLLGHTAFQEACGPILEAAGLKRLLRLFVEAARSSRARDRHSLYHTAFTLSGSAVETSHLDWSFGTSCGRFERRAGIVLGSRDGVRCVRSPRSTASD
eukprot:Polyplicarium_translucidae@DN92_c0_g1_i1.p1